MNNKLAVNKKKIDISKVLLGNKTVFILILLLFIMSLVSDVFLTKTNLFNVLRQICVSVILGCGYTIIIGSGHIDLSVGTMMGLVGILVGKLLLAGVPITIAIFIGCLIGASCGALNATLITVFGLQPFIVTLATKSLYEGIGYLVTKMVPVSGLPKEFITLGQGTFLSIPIPVYVMFLTLVVMIVTVSRTKLGRHAIAIGGNTEAARVSGINVGRTRLKVYMIAGVCVGIAAAMLTARSASAQVAAGQGMEMDSIAAVVMGGTPMGGGKATVLGTLFGCIIVGVVKNGLNLLGVDPNWQVIAKGMMILLAVVLDVISTRMYSNRNKTTKVK
jgi:ribose/xylose/arabinose/galactoside ABC-type transport system permease subunit